MRSVFYIFILYLIVNVSVFAKSKVHPTLTEDKIAKNLSSLLDLSRNGHINYHLVKKLESDMKKSITFYSYLVWPQNILAIQKASTLKSVSDTCHRIENIETASFVEKELLQNSLKICLNKYLRFLSENSNKSLSFHQKESTKFKPYVNYFLNQTNFDELKFFLSRFNPNDHRLILYSKIVEDFYISSNLVPPKHLVGYLHITNTLSSYIQSASFEKDENEEAFFKSFITMKNSILELADKNESHTLELRSFINFIHINQDLLPIDRSLKNLLSLGKSLARRSLYSEARDCFNKIISLNSYYKEDAVFELLWSYTTQENYDDAIKYVVNKYDNIMEDDSKFLFWSAISFSEEGEKEKAHIRFKKVISLNPLSYYAIISSKMIKDEDSLADAKGRFYASVKEADIGSEPEKLDHRWLRRVNLFAKYSDSRLLKAELSNIETQQSENMLSKHLLLAAEQLAQNGNYIQSFKVIYNSMRQKNIAFSKDVISILFPNVFSDELSEINMDFDPVIALSLIRQESGFNKEAISRVGARGLMQLMPSTAKQFKKDLEIRHLYNPATNLKIGTTYLQGLMDRYDNNLVLSLAAYNAGESRVDKWKEIYLNKKSILHNIENIPFNETRKYVKLIFRNIFFYKMMNEKNQIDSSSLNKIYDVKLGFQ